MLPRPPELYFTPFNDDALFIVDNGAVFSLLNDVDFLAKEPVRAENPHSLMFKCSRVHVFFSPDFMNTFINSRFKIRLKKKYLCLTLFCHHPSRFIIILLPKNHINKTSRQNRDAFVKYMIVIWGY